MRKLFFIGVLFTIIFFTACANSNQALENKEVEKVIPNQEVSTDSIQMNTTSSEHITIERLLREFNDWDGNKELGQILYMLNLNKDTYILTANPNNSEDSKIDWVEMIYIKPLNQSYVISKEELEPFQKLVTVLNIQDTSLVSSIISTSIPYEKKYNDWNLKVDYYVYQDKKEGISLTISNLNQPVDINFSVVDELSKQRQEFADKIRGALGPVCNKVYFNSKGEFIIEVNSEWNTINNESKKDLIYSIENQLRKVKKGLEVEGYGQFFSPVGRALESFYAN